MTTTGKKRPWVNISMVSQSFVLKSRGDKGKATGFSKFGIPHSNIYVLIEGQKKKIHLINPTPPQDSITNPSDMP